MDFARSKNLYIRIKTIILGINKNILLLSRTDVRISFCCVADFQSREDVFYLGLFLNRPFLLQDSDGSLEQLHFLDCFSGLPLKLNQVTICLK